MEMRKRVLVGLKGIVILIVTLTAVLFIQFHSYRGFIAWDSNRTKSERVFVETIKHSDISLHRQMENSAKISPEVDGGTRIYVNQHMEWDYRISTSKLGADRITGVILAAKSVGETDENQNFEALFEIDGRAGEALLERLSNPIEGLALAKNGHCLDGTYVGFELWEYGKVYGGSGNAECTPEYAEIVVLLDEMLKAAADGPPDEIYASSRKGRLAKID